MATMNEATCRARQNVMSLAEQWKSLAEEHKNHKSMGCNHLGLESRGNIPVVGNSNEDRTAY